MLYTHAGPEIAVASTKAFLAQITAAYLLGLYLAQLRGNMFQGEIKDVLADLGKIPAKIQQVLDNDEPDQGPGPRAWRTPSPCCSWAATWASRWPWKAR